MNVNIRNLAGVPSIVYGILGFTIFTKALQGITGPGRAEGRTIISAGLTLAILVLPIVIITAVRGGAGRAQLAARGGLRRRAPPAGR